jgi:putative protein-disulfide isomerase
MRIVYVYDALCGWCYGFSPVINRLYEKYKSKLGIEVVSGGMILGKKSGPVGKVAAYISEAYKQVEDKTGVEFGSAFLEGTLKEGKVVFDSFPPAKALKIVKELKDVRTLPYATDIQKAIYYDGADPSNVDLYKDLASAHGISVKDFEILWSSPDYQVRTHEEFIFAQQLNVTGYPTVFIEEDSTYHLLARGYTSYKVLRDRLEHLVGFAESR